MGCDIHLYTEYKRKTDNHWQHFGGRINPGRNYFMFGIMSKGVRSRPSFSFEQKGLPSDLSYQSSRDAYLIINNDYQDNEGYCSLEQAKRYETYGKEIIYNEGQPYKVQHPDWHSHSWLTTEEFKQVMIFYNQEASRVVGDFCEPEYEAVLAAMRRFIELGCDVRIVFWFDN